MKITVKLEKEEFCKLISTSAEIASEIDEDEPDTKQFSNFEADCGAIKLQSKEIGTYDIDVDSKFVCWVLRKSVSCMRFGKAIATFFKDFIDDASVFFKNPEFKSLEKEASDVNESEKDTSDTGGSENETCDSSDCLDKYPKDSICTIF